jgi:tetratricopeptide (TPR) repeat protein
MMHRSPGHHPVVAAAVAAALFSIFAAGCEPADPLTEVRRLQAAGNFAGSIEPLRQMLEGHPDDAETNYLYGVALVRIGQPSVALWPFRKAAKDPEWLVPASLELAASELRSANHDEAIEVTGRLLEAQPDHIDALLLRSLARSQSRRDYPGALADADRVLELDPDNLDALAPRAVALLGLERVEEAERAIDTLDRRFREGDLSGAGSERYCVSRALFASEKGNAEAADRIFAECLEAYPAGFEATSEAVKFYDGQGRVERSLEILQAILAAQPFNVHVREAIAQRLAAQGEREAAEGLLLEGTKLDPPQLAFAAWVSLANYYIASEEFAAGVSALEQAIGLVEQPGHDLLFRYADILVMAGEHEKAREVAVELEVPAHREIILGRVHLEQGRPAEALERLSAGLLFWPNNAVARYYAALASERVGDIDRAISEYRYSIRADAGATDARLRLGQLHQAEGAYEEAMVGAGHRGNDVPFDSELDLFWIEVSARTGMINESNARRALIEGSPEVSGSQVAAMAKGAIVRNGPGAGARLVRAVPQLDLTDPENSAALHVLVADLVAAKRADAALAQVEVGLVVHPESADFQALRGLALEAVGDDHAAGAAFERALASDSKNPVALSGLARAAAASGDVAGALALYTRAAAADPDDPEPQRAAAELLAASGNPAAAEEQLELLLVQQPYDAATAARLAELRLERDADGERTFALARMAVRFQGGPDAYELLGRVHRLRGEPKLAAEAEQRAERVRAASRARSTEPQSDGPRN